MGGRPGRDAELAVGPLIVADTSAWVGFLRGQQDGPAGELHRLISSGADLAITEVIAMEVLAGARSVTHHSLLRSRLLAFPVLTLKGLGDFESAALIYQTCRMGGDTIRSFTDCLIAIPTIRAGASILHEDSDFDAIARHTELAIYPRAVETS